MSDYLRSTTAVLLASYSRPTPVVLASHRRFRARRHLSRAAARRGIILLLVLVVVAILSLAALGFAELMLNERRAAVASGRQSQARSFALSGAQVACQFLNRDPSDQISGGGTYDNASRFADQLVADEPAPQDRGHFSVVAPKTDGVTISGVRYGLQDESTRINLATILNYDTAAGTATVNASTGNASNEPTAGNTNAHLMLMGLPGMTDDVADAILDWIDADDNARPNGAESQYYLALPHPYLPRNGPPVTIDELLQVRGVTPELLFGLDAAKMGLSSSTGTAGLNLPGVDNSNGVMDHGWAAYLTLWSAEGTLNSSGSAKINLNDPDLETLYNSLVEAIDEPSAQFIVAYRLGGRGEATGSGQLDTSKLSEEQGGTQLSSPLDLVGATASLIAPSSGTQAASDFVAGSGPASPPPISVKNPFANDSGSMANYLPKLFANCTTTANTSIPGRININQASQTVLLCIPGMTSDLVNQIISQRTQDPAAQTDVDQCPAWPLIRGLVPLATMRAIMPYINAGGSVYRAQVIGSFEKGTTSARIEVVIDATQNPASIVFWKDISRVQGGFPVEPPPPGK